MIMPEVRTMVAGKKQIVTVSVAVFIDSPRSLGRQQGKGVGPA